MVIHRHWSVRIGSGWEVSQYLVPNNVESFVLSKFDVRQIVGRKLTLNCAGVRPIIVWICDLGLATQFFIMPIGEKATAIWLPHIKLPKLQTEELMTLTLSLLWLGGMRSFEKSRGVARESMKK